MKPRGIRLLRFRGATGRSGDADPLPLEIGLREAIAELGVGGRLLEQQALLLWPRVVGALVGGGVEEVARAERISNGELLVSVEQDAWRHRLHFELKRICKELNRVVGRDVVRSIRLTGIWKRPNSIAKRS